MQHTKHRMLSWKLVLAFFYKILQSQFLAWRVSPLHFLWPCFWLPMIAVCCFSYSLMTHWPWSKWKTSTENWVRRGLGFSVGRCGVGHPQEARSANYQDGWTASLQPTPLWWHFQQIPSTQQWFAGWQHLLHLGSAKLHLSTDVGIRTCSYCHELISFY